MSRRKRYDWEDDELPEARRFARHAGLSVAGWIVVGTLFFVALGGAIWGGGVLLSDARGAGDARVQVNSAANRLEAQRKYNALYEGVLAADKKINGMAAEAASDFDRTNVRGAINVCLETVADYNRMAGDVLTAKWKPESLPARIGDDPATDCQPTAPTTVPTPAR